MKPKVGWQPLTKPVGTVVPPKSPPSNGEVLQLIEKIKEIFESAAQAQGTLPAALLKSSASTLMAMGH